MFLEMECTQYFSPSSHASRNEACQSYITIRTKSVVRLISVNLNSCAFAKILSNCLRFPVRERGKFDFDPHFAFSTIFLFKGGGPRQIFLEDQI